MSDRQNNTVVLATAAHDGSIKYWHAASGTSNRTIPPVPGETQVNCLTTSPDKHYLAAGGNTNLRLFDSSSNSLPVLTYQGHTGNITSAVFQRDGKWIATGSEDGTIKLWDTRAPGVQRELHCGSSISSIALHGNQGEIISCDDDGSMRVWDLSLSKTTLETVPEEHVSCSSVAINPDSSMIALSNHNGNCYVWKLTGSRTNTLEPSEKIEASTTYLTKILFSPNGKYIATCSADHSCKLWSTGSSFELYRDLYDHHGWVWDASFSADSAYIVTASSDRAAKLWDIQSSEVLLEYRGHSRGLTAVALNDT
jgi:G protein beta subunit-like protein